MPINKKTLRRHFNLAAGQYDAHCALQKLTAGHLATLINKTDRTLNVLEIGCGTGYFTRLLLRKFPNGAITAVDISEKMLAIAKTNLRRDGKVRFVQADGEQMPFTDPVDCIVSSATFQWFNNLETSFRNLATLLRPGGKLIFSTLVQGTFHELFSCFQDCAKEERISFRHPAQILCPAEDVQRLLSQAGFSIHSFLVADRRLSFPSFAAFHRSIKQTGASNAEENRPRIPRSIARRVARRYEEKYRNDLGEVIATYRVAFLAGHRRG